MPTPVSWRTFYTSEFQELFVNITKIVKAKIMNETKKLPSHSEECKGRPSLSLWDRWWGKDGRGSLGEVSASSPVPPCLSSLLELQRPP